MAKQFNSGNQPFYPIPRSKRAGGLSKATMSPQDAYLRLQTGFVPKSDSVFRPAGDLVPLH
jgi:hypothetical protein